MINFWRNKWLKFIINSNIKHIFFKKITLIPIITPILSLPSCDITYNVIPFDMTCDITYNILPSHIDCDISYNIVPIDMTCDITYSIK